MAPFRSGCVIFDSADPPRNGWASCDGGECRRIASPTEIDTDRLWLTNLSRQALYRNGLSRHACFRPDSYLSIGVAEIGDLLGIDPEDAPGLAQALSAVLANIARLLFALFGIDKAPPYDLGYGLRRILAPADPLFSDDELAEAFCESQVNFVRCLTQIPDELAPRPVRLLPVKHAIDILSAPVPVGARRWRRRDWKGRSLAALLDWCGDDTQALAKITVHRFSDDRLGRLINFGSFSERRRWAPLPDLRILHEGGAEVTVHRVFYCEEAPVRPLSDMDILSPLSPQWAISLSAAIVAECLWTALAKPSPPPPHVAAERTSANPAAPFVRAWDRMLCLAAADRLDRAGAVVTGYGKGKVHCLENSAPGLDDTMFWIQDADDGEADFAYRTAAHLFATRDAGLILETDAEFVDSLS